MAGRVLVRNPASGGTRCSTGPGDTYVFARESAAAGATLVAACGGDGTLNEVVRGVDDAGRLDGTTARRDGSTWAKRAARRPVTPVRELLCRRADRRGERAARRRR